MKRFLLSVALLLACSGVALAQESEFSGGGGGGITAAPGSGTVNVLPRFASATSVVDSPFVVGGTAAAPVLHFSLSGVVGITSPAIYATTSNIALRNGADTGYVVLTAADIASTYNASSGIGGGWADAAFTSFRAVANKGDVGTFQIGSTGAYNFGSTTGNQRTEVPDTGIARSAAGILAVTDGSTGQGGIGIADSATNTVSDALILRHQGGAVNGNGFGTGLVWQGENDGGVMHPMASIDAVWSLDDDTNEQSQFKFSTYDVGGELPILTLYKSGGETKLDAPYNMDLIAGNVLALYGATQLTFVTNGANKWIIPATGEFYPASTNTYDIGTSTLAVKDIYAAGLAVSDAATNTVTDAIALRHATSGTATTGFGTGLLFQGEDAAGNMQDMASIDAVYTDATNGSEDVNFKFSTFAAGAEVNPILTLRNASSITAMSAPANMTIESASGYLELSAQGGGLIYLARGGSGRWHVDSNNNFAPFGDVMYDLGSSTYRVKDSYLGTSIQGTRTQAISDNAAAATFVTIAVPTSDTTVGGRIFYTITAIDAGTAIQTKTGTYSFGLNNIGGTVTGAGTDVLEHSQLSTGTLAPTFSVNISGTNAQFQLVLDTSLDAGAETLKIEYRVQIDSGTATVTPAT